MNAKKFFQKLYKRLVFEAILLSLMTGLAIGFGCGFISALVSWLTSFKGGLWLSLGIIFGVTVISAAIFYFARFRPSVIGCAKRIDALGLKERMITMLELKEDDSVMSRFQRTDATAHLSRVRGSQLKIKVKPILIVMLAVSITLSSTMMLFDTLGAHGVIPNPDDFVQEFPVAVTYEAEDGGYISGEADQLIEYGSNAETVVAVANEGYEFSEWSDGYTFPERTDLNITEDKIFIAVFMPIEGDDDSGGGSDKPVDSPDKEVTDDPEAAPSTDENKPGSQLTGKYEHANQVIDGETYYREVLEMYKQLLADRLEIDIDDLTEEQLAIIEAYLGIV